MSPTFSVVAPVNAPLVWPKSSDSIRSFGRAAQLILIHGPSARRLRSWSAFAISSLPVPLSPTISTLASASATAATVSSTRWIDGARPRISLSATCSTRRRRRSEFSATSFRCSTARFTSPTTSSGSNGFSSTWKAPASLVASIALRTEPYAVITSTSSSGSRARSSRVSARPSPSGSLRSTIAPCTSLCETAASAVLMLPAIRTEYPSPSSVIRSPSAMLGSSSTTRMVLPRFMMEKPPRSLLDPPGPARRRLDRKLDQHTRSRTRRARDREPPAVKIHDGPRDRHPETGALRLGGEEQIEDAGRRLFVHADARVLDRDRHRPLSRVVHRRDGEPAPRSQGLEPVHHQVQEGLAQLAAVDEGLRARGVVRARHRDVFGVDTCSRERDAFVEHRIERHPRAV